MKLISLVVPMLFVLGTGAYAVAPREEILTPIVLGVNAEDHTLLITGRSLDQVELWAIPPEEYGHEEAYRHLGNAVKNKRGTGKIEIWKFNLQDQSLTPVEIFAEGFDGEGVSVGRVPLSYLNADGLYDSLYK
jgi:hypothetical protein